MSDAPAAGRTKVSTSLPGSPRTRSARLAVALCFLLNGLLYATWVSRIPAIRDHLGLNHRAFGLALLCSGIGAVLSMPVAGWCSTRFGSRVVTQISGLAAMAILPFLAFAPNLGLLSLLLFLTGAVHGGFDVAMNAQAVAVEESYGRPIMSSFHALWSTGALGGAALGGGLAKLGLPPTLHFSIASGLLIVAALTMALPRLLHIDVAARHAARHLSSRRWTWPPRRLVALGAIAFCVMMGEGAMADWSGLYLREFAHASEALAAAGYAAFSVAMAAGRFSGDALTTRLGRVRVLRGSGLLAAAGLALALVAPHAAPVMIGLAAVGAGFATVVPLVFSAAGRTEGIGPDAALAVTTCVGYSGFLIGPPVIGFVAEALNLRVALAFIVFSSSLLAVLARFAAEPVRRHWPPGLPTAWEESSQTLT